MNIELGHKVTFNIPKYDIEYLEQYIEVLKINLNNLKKEQEENNWNPYVDEGYVFSIVSDAPYKHTVKKRTDHVAIGNFFRTYEEANTIGRWFYKDKLIIDQQLRDLGIHNVYKDLYWNKTFIVHMISTDTLRDLMINTSQSSKECQDLINKINAILGDNAKRYITGKY